MYLLSLVDVQAIQMVVSLNQHNYTKVTNSVIVDVFSENFRYIRFDGCLWICKTRDGALSHGKMPIQAKANGLNLSEICPELSCLDILMCPIYKNGGITFRQAARYTRTSC